MRWWWLGSALVLAACSFESGSGSGSGNGGGSEGGTTSSAETGTTTATTAASAGATSSPSTTTSTSDTMTTTPSTGEGSTSDSGDPSDAGGSSETTTGSSAATLDIVRLEIACMGTSNCSSAYCDTVATAAAAQTLMGDDAVTYDVTLRIRGVVEQKTYLGGNTDGFWNDGGTPQDDDWNTYQLEISDPAQIYYINAGNTGNAYCDALDYSRTVPVRSGATLTVTMSDAGSSCGAYNVDSNGVPIVIDGIPPAPDPFDGQFVQVDAVEILPQ